VATWDRRHQQFSDYAQRMARERIEVSKKLLNETAELAKGYLPTAY
jgi:hypothetical protein